MVNALVSAIVGVGQHSGFHMGHSQRFSRAVGYNSVLQVTFFSPTPVVSLVTFTVNGTEALRIQLGHPQRRTLSPGMRVGPLVGRPTPIALFFPGGSVFHNDTSVPPSRSWGTDLSSSQRRRHVFLQGLCGDPAKVPSAGFEGRLGGFLRNTFPLWW